MGNSGIQLKEMDEKNKEISMEKISKSIDNMFSQEQILVIHNSVAKGTTMAELAYFLNVAKSVQLNPFNKEIWCYKDKKNNLIIFSGRDGFLAKAQQNPEFAGIRSAEVKSKDEFSIDIANNKIVHTISNLPTDRGEILGAYAIVFRKNGEPTVVFVEMHRYNKGYNTWKTHPEDMIKKVAESKALKLAFGISGIQLEDEFDIKDGIALPRDGEEFKKRLLSAKEFKQFISQSNDYIERYRERFDFTEEQLQQVNNKLDQTA
jgi:phage recombination protein Bet